MAFPLATLQAIKNEIDTDPTSRGYAGKTDSEICALMTTPISQSPQIFTDLNIGIQDVILLLIKRGKWRAVVNAAATDDNAFGLVEAGKLTSIHDNTFVSGAFRTGIDNLVTATILNNADRNAILNLSRQEVLMSRAEFLLGFNAVLRVGDITQARAS